MTAALKLPVISPRFLDVPECTHLGSGKCQDAMCRYSVLESWPNLALWDAEDRAELIAALPDTCALGLAECGGLSTEEVATLLGLPRDSVCRMESVALRRLTLRRDLRRAHRDG